ncbi:MAG: UvrD-helicase domain-containing protein [Rhizobiales bacterium]|nr:UvrD-helicase domain-containing protein [Hyphomicrobiales bacterium]
MAVAEIDLLGISQGAVAAPAGCGKTELIANALRRYSGPKPVLVLTHTNAGVAALRGRLERSGVGSSAYRLSTIDGWAIRLISTFPTRSGLDATILKVETPGNDYPAIRDAACRLLSGGHIRDVLASSYARLIVDEYQDCSVPQHTLVCRAADTLPTVILGDPLQAIFGWRGNEVADWNKEVCVRFPIVGQLGTPWRWKNADTETFGRWLLEVRRRLQTGQIVNLREAPPEVQWIRLDGTDDHGKQREAARTPAPDANAKVIILGDSRPASHRLIASQTPGAITVENVDLRDLVDFAQGLDFPAPDALKHVVQFAGSVMTNVGGADLLQRVAVLLRGGGRKQPSETEQAALDFVTRPCPELAAALLSAINQSPGVRAYRLGVLRSALRALNQCDGNVGNSFAETAVRVREQNRIVGRPLAKRSVGSTLLLKGLEAEVAVILNAGDMDARNLYVAMTRGSKKLVICSKSPVLNPAKPA